MFESFFVENDPLEVGSRKVKQLQMSLKHDLS